MSDNYPDSVTGNEAQIVGRPVYVEHVACDNTSTLYVPVYVAAEFNRQVRNLLDKALAGQPLPPESYVVFHHFQTLLEEHSAEFACDYEGDVEVEYSGMVRLWSCPRCGTDHEDDLSDDFAEQAAERMADRMMEEGY